MATLSINLVSDSKIQSPHPSVIEVCQHSDLMKTIFCYLNRKEMLEMRLVRKQWSDILNNPIKSVLCDELDQKMSFFLTTIQKTSREYLRAMGLDVLALSFEEACRSLTFTKCEVMLGECCAMDQSLGWKPRDTLHEIAKDASCEDPCSTHFFKKVIPHGVGLCFAKLKTLPKGVGLYEKVDYIFFKLNESIRYSCFPIALFGLKKEGIQQPTPGDFILPVASIINNSYCFPMGGRLFEFIVHPNESEWESCGTSEEEYCSQEEETGERRIRGDTLYLIHDHYIPDLEFAMTKKEIEVYKCGV